MKTLARLSICITLLFLTVLSCIAQSSIQDKDLKQAVKREDKSFFKPFGAGFALSTVVCVVGAATDLGTSQGKRELNPLLRNDSGGLNTGRALLIKLSACAWPALIERRHPKLAFWARTSAGIAWGLVAMRN